MPAFKPVTALVRGLLVLNVVSRRKKNGSFGFPNAFVEKTLGVSATSRNWTTVTKIAALVRRGGDA